MRADSLRVGRGGRVFDEFQPIHAALERVEGGRGEGERFGDVVHEFDGQPGQLGYVLVDRLLDVGIARILEDRGGFRQSIYLEQIPRMNEPESIHTCPSPSSRCQNGSPSFHGFIPGVPKSNC